MTDFGTAPAHSSIIHPPTNHSIKPDDKSSKLALIFLHWLGSDFSYFRNKPRLLGRGSPCGRVQRGYSAPSGVERGSNPAPRVSTAGQVVEWYRPSAQQQLDSLIDQRLVKSFLVSFIIQDLKTCSWQVQEFVSCFWNHQVVCKAKRRRLTIGLSIRFRCPRSQVSFTLNSTFFTRLNGKSNRESEVGKQNFRARV